MQLFKYPEENDWPELLKRPVLDSLSLEKTVSEILLNVKTKGDTALKEYTEKFGGPALENFAVKDFEIVGSGALIIPELKQAISLAKENIEKFHSKQKEEELWVETMPGIKCFRRSVAIEKVGLYIPGGTAPLFSTVLMLAIPAKLAGCKEIIICSPPDSKGNLHPAILYAAKICGVTKIFKAGGAQAIAAMAYGTESIQKVYKIFGPGNQYVTCAKQLVNKEGIAIDMPAGPSELAVLADEFCVPEFVAADLLSQAEHGADSQVVLVCTNEKIIESIISEISLQLKDLPRKEIAEKALKNSKAILVKDLNEGMHLLNEYAPEHLILACKEPNKISLQVKNAGSVFIGNFSCESAGDYASGTNHTLPTNGYAKAYSGVSLDSFVKKITFQELTREGIKNIGSAIETMAEAEGLQAHKNAVTVRLKNLQK
ncbi:MAG: histidinol dehydrogenase [Bacteroidia bacterium]|nr:histidinol dehydrogenase [Bacteroidia bacterium]